MSTKTTLLFLPFYFKPLVCSHAEIIQNVSLKTGSASLKTSTLKLWLYTVLSQLKASNATIPVSLWIISTKLLKATLSLYDVSLESLHVMNKLGELTHKHKWIEAHSLSWRVGVTNHQRAHGHHFVGNTQDTNESGHSEEQSMQSGLMQQQQTPVHSWMWHCRA